MTKPLTTNGVQELRDPAGQIFGYFITPEEMHCFHEERRTYIRQLRSLLPRVSPEKRAEIEAFLDSIEPPDEPTILNR